MQCLPFQFFLAILLLFVYKEEDFKKLETLLIPSFIKKRSDES